MAGCLKNTGDEAAKALNFRQVRVTGGAVNG
jgi:hypothetical protein